MDANILNQIFANLVQQNIILIHNKNPQQTKNWKEFSRSNKEHL